MNIIKSFPEELSRRDAYKLTESQTTRKLIELAGSIIEPEKWVLFEDEEKTVLTIEADGELYGTISGTFIDAFIKAFDNLGSDMGPIRIVTVTSRVGRTYVTCELA